MPFGSVEVDGDRRDTGPRPFAVRLGRWDVWRPVAGGLRAHRWRLAVWLDHHGLFLLEDDGRLWHKRARVAMTGGAWFEDDRAGRAPDWTKPASWAAVSGATGRGMLLVVNGAEVLARVSDQSGRWSRPWVELSPLTSGTGVFPDPVPLGMSSTVAAVPVDNALAGVADLYLTGTDGDVYTKTGWSPDADQGLWTRLETVEFELAPGSALSVVGGYVVALSTQGTLWGRHRDWVVLLGGGWEDLGGPGFAVSRFAAGGVEGDVHIAACGPAGQISLGRRVGDDGPRGAHRLRAWCRRHRPVSDACRPRLATRRPRTAPPRRPGLEGRRLLPGPGTGGGLHRLGRAFAGVDLVVVDAAMLAWQRAALNRGPSAIGSRDDPSHQETRTGTAQVGNGASATSALRAAGPAGDDGLQFDAIGSR